jgi:hypothetical protein
MERLHLEKGDLDVGFGRLMPVDPVIAVAGPETLTALPTLRSSKSWGWTCQCCSNFGSSSRTCCMVISEAPC